MAITHQGFTYPAVDDPPASVNTYPYTPPAAAAGILALFHVNNNGASASSVTYGGVALAKVDDAVDASGEPVRIEAWYLGAGIPGGTQNLVVTLNTAEYLSPIIISVAAAADTEVVAFGIRENNQANPQIALDSGARSALRYCGIASGLAAVGNLSPVAGMTAVGSRDHGSIVERYDRRTSAETGSQTIGYTASSDDVAMVALALAEVEAGGDTFTEDFIDPLGLGDTAAREVEAAREVTDGLGLTDAATREVEAARAPVELLGLTDAATREVEAVREVADGLGLTDRLTAQRSLPRALGPDPLGLTDTAAREVEAARAPVDQLGLTDTAATASEAARTAVDPIGLTDAAQTASEATRSPQDALGLTDAAQRATEATRSPQDALGLTDAATREVEAVRAPVDALGLTDRLDVVVQAPPAERDIIDPLGLTDTISRQVEAARALVDPFGFTDTIAALAAQLRAPSDPLGLTDRLTVTLGTVQLRAKTDALGLTDRLSFDVGPIGSWLVPDPIAFNPAGVTIGPGSIPDAGTALFIVPDPIASVPDD
jgi:hypothetical protein